ncbi:MAG: hypothetical protein A3K76_06990 [Euryarchaeota archaeon RBG_13_57_23]|nr:MAG: hypothetical protein A3K76_06990 [Euryarchaeota archaeon RBG_13_57_23]
MGNIIAPGATPPWLPREVAEGRKFAWWAQISFLGMAALWFILAIVLVVLYIADGTGRGGLIVGVFGFFAMVICFLAGVFVKRTVIDAIDQGRFHDAKNDCIIWIIFGMIGFVIPALFMILAYAKIGDSLATQAPVGYQPYAQGMAVAQQPAPYMPPPAPIQQPPPQQAQPATAQAQHHGHQTPMVRCKNCNVQFPVFMHSCPNCGAPKEG